jgi:hypothetical protein
VALARLGHASAPQRRDLALQPEHAALQAFVFGPHRLWRGS